MPDGSVGAFLFIFHEFRCLNGRGRGAFFHQWLTEAWGRFLFIFNEFDVIEQTPAWGVLSPMTDGSVGIGRGFIFCEFRWLDQSRAWGICLRLKMI